MGRSEILARGGRSNEGSQSTADKASPATSVASPSSALRGCRKRKRGSGEPSATLARASGKAPSGLDSGFHACTLHSCETITTKCTSLSGWPPSQRRHSLVARHTSAKGCGYLSPGVPILYRSCLSLVGPLLPSGQLHMQYCCRIRCVSHPVLVVATLNGKESVKRSACVLVCLCL